MSKKQPHQRKKKKRKPGRKGKSSSEGPIYTSSGMMGKMVGGFRSAVGVGGAGPKKKPRSTVDRLLTILLMLAVAAFVIYRFLLPALRHGK